MRALPHLFVCSAISVATLSVAGAATYTDTFTDGVANGGADNSGIAWFDRSANSNLSVDATGGQLTGNALNLNLGSATTAGNGVGSRGIIGVLGTTLTPAIGDSLSLSFDFQFRATPNDIAQTTFTSSPRNSTQGFTFGFYNSVGTAVTADDSANSDNDRGFRGSIGSGTGANAAAGIFRETNSGAGGLGTTNTTVGPPATSDSVDVTNAGATAVNVNDFLKHNGLFKMTRTGADEYSLEMWYDDVMIATGTSTIGAYTSFNEVVFSQGGSNNFSIDNVVVTFVPEPAAAMLGALGGLFLLRRRR